MKKTLRLIGFLLVLIISMSLTISAFAATGSIQVSCEGTHFTGELAAGETGRLELTLFDGVQWDPNGPKLQDVVIPLGEGPFDVFVPWTADTDGNAYRVAIVVDGVWPPIAVFEEVLDCPPPPPPPGGEGCTPGYWKNHLEDWLPTGYSPGDDFDTTFGTDYFSPDITLDDAVNAKGGGVRKLARHGTAALLSAAHPDVAYPFTEAQVIAMVQSGDKGEIDELVAANELGCQIP